MLLYIKMGLRKYNSVEEAIEMNRKKNRERYHEKMKSSSRKVSIGKRGRKPLTPEEKEQQRIRRNAYSREYYRKRKEML
jgi:hypothetical protein